MKVVTWSAALLCASVTATVTAMLERRQDGVPDVSNGLPGMWESPIAKAESIKPVTPQYFKDAKRTLIRYVPFTLPARNSNVREPSLLLLLLGPFPARSPSDAFWWGAFLFSFAKTGC